MIVSVSAPNTPAYRLHGRIRRPSVAVRETVAHVGSSAIIGEPSAEAGARRVACTALFPSSIAATYFVFFRPTRRPSGLPSCVCTRARCTRVHAATSFAASVAADLHERWRVRFVDENIERALHSDFAWADVVFVGGMHIELSEVRDIQRRAKSCGKLTVLGGSAVSSSPEAYPEFDYLHLGEIGDATDELIATLDGGVDEPTAQRRFETRERLPLSSFPLPRYDAVPLARYLIGSLQFSSGCPIGANSATFRLCMAASRASVSAQQLLTVCQCLCLPTVSSAGDLSGR